MRTVPISSVSLRFEYDIVAARRRARQVAALLGFDGQNQTRIATVASEISRNALQYAGGGRIEMGIETGGPRGEMLVMTISDRGPGIAHVDEVLGGTYRSPSGMGLGLIGARRLMDDLNIHTGAGKGTTVIVRKRIPSEAGKLDQDRIHSIVESLAGQKADSPIEEIQQQNSELLEALGSLTERQQELERLNQELEDTNRGVLALYAELDEKAESLRQADRIKSRFLSDMSHEFRTPVNAILALTRLLEEADLQPDSRKQVSLIRKAAEDLEALVSDLLDLAKIEAGKVEIRPAEFEISNLFSALRGMLRPLLTNPNVALVFEEAQELPPMYSDEGKVSQILRNFISNALKFTESGEVRVSACVNRGETVTFSVSDSGIGIAAEDQERIFEEFTQVANPLQRNVKGTGLGLPLTRKLAKLLGGSVTLRSEPGVGSTFFAEIPVRLGGGAAAEVAPGKPAVRRRILIVDDDETARYTLSSFAAGSGIEITEAENGQQGLDRARADRPDLIFLDLMMPGIGGHEVLQRLADDPATAQIPVVIVTSRFINDDEQRRIMSRASSVVNKADLSRDVVSRAIDRALRQPASR